VQTAGGFRTIGFRSDFPQILIGFGCNGKQTEQKKQKAVVNKAVFLGSSTPVAIETQGAV